MRGLWRSKEKYFPPDLLPPITNSTDIWMKLPAMVDRIGFSAYYNLSHSFTSSSLLFCQFSVASPCKSVVSIQKGHMNIDDLTSNWHTCN